MLKIYNTLTHKKEIFQTIKSKEIGMYVCGVTVYDLCHIGHSRTFIVFDIIARYLRYYGYKLKYVRNITDIDDKIIKRALNNQETIETLTNRMIIEMHTDFAALNILPPDIEPRATHHIDDMIDIISDLLVRNYAYIAYNGDVMFNIDYSNEYGSLSRQNIKKLKFSTKNINCNHKHNNIDFVLWKKNHHTNEPSWNSPWGKGRPGWHIGCSAMNLKYLGNHIDIHGGGLDLLFPHHENEIAQCCAYAKKTYKQYVNYWIHSGMIMINNHKMSKSFDNYLTIRDILKIYDGETIRYFMISNHYRSKLDYSDSKIIQAKKSLKRLYIALFNTEPSNYSYNPNNKELLNISLFEDRFRNAMDDDFNTPKACSILFDLAHQLNFYKKKKKYNIVNNLASCLRFLAKILGILQQNPQSFLQTNVNNDSLNIELIENLIFQRNKARKLKDWNKADSIRKKLSIMGIILEDNLQGTTCWRQAK
ncbi:MAG: cysteine--tRNA ligase [Candidatus Dasytiphilus stammeri]